MSNFEAKYQEFAKYAREVDDLNGAIYFLEWDLRTLMPPKGQNSRSHQISSLAGMVHDLHTDDRFWDLVQGLSESANNGEGTEFQKSNIRVLQRNLIRWRKVPSDLVRAIASATTGSHPHWVNARKAADFSIFAPYLEKIIELKIQEAEAVGYDDRLYDALLDEFEPYATTKEVETVLSRLREKLVPILESVKQAEKPRTDFLYREFSTGDQARFGRMIVEEMGFDLEAGRIDVSEHPFCSGFSPDDVRITTRYSKHDIKSALFGLMHEAGHGLYEQGLPRDQIGLPAGKAVSLGIHESQSRLWENMVGRSKFFWKRHFTHIQKIFSSQLEDVTEDEFIRAINVVEPSYIRVEADEVTYNLHVILRFELEQALLSRDLKVRDIPGAWNEKMKSYLNIVPPKDSDGCLQDVHWSAGIFGYFPTYALGNIYSAQFFSSARKSLNDLDSDIERGDFTGLRNWLKEHVHSNGSLYKPSELVQRAAGEPLNEDHLIGYLKEKVAITYNI